MSSLLGSNGALTPRKDAHRIGTDFSTAGNPDFVISTDQSRYHAIMVGFTTHGSKGVRLYRTGTHIKAWGTGYWDGGGHDVYLDGTSNRIIVVHDESRIGGWLFAVKVPSNNKWWGSVLPQAGNNDRYRSLVMELTNATALIMDATGTVTSRTFVAWGQPA